MNDNENNMRDLLILLRIVVLIGLVVLFSILAVRCSKEDMTTVEPAPPPPPVVLQDFTERYTGRYSLKANNPDTWVVEFRPSEYWFNVINDSQGCAYYHNLVSNDTNFEIVSHTPDEYKYRITRDGGDYRDQTFTKVPGGVSRLREFFNAQSVLDSTYSQTFLSYSPQITRCTAQEWRDHYGLRFDTTFDYWEAFKMDADKYNVDYPDVGINIQILPDAEYNAGSNARASLCDDGINVEVRDSWWREANDIQRFNTMYHEFGHALLNLAHVCDQTQLMYTGATEFNEECGDDLIRLTQETPDEDNPYTFVGFQRAVADMLTLNKQIVYPCTAGKGGHIIHD